MSRISQKTASYDVGYKKPPKKHRFKKGRSGNQRGSKRSKGNSLDVFKRLVGQRVQIRIDGATHTMTLGEAVIFVNFRKALSGNQSALNNFDGIMNEAQMLLDLADKSQVGGIIMIPEHPKSSEEFEERIRHEQPLHVLRLELNRKQMDLREKQVSANLPLSPMRG